MHAFLTSKKDEHVCFSYIQTFRKRVGDVVLRLFVPVVGFCSVFVFALLFFCFVLFFVL